MSGFSAYDAQRTGPCAAAFLQSDKEVAAIMGPEGSGKSGASVMKFAQAALFQQPSPRDGVRRVRGVTIRDTYPLLEKNTLPSWFNFFPKDDSFNGTAPMTHTIRKNFLGYPIEIINIFVAVGEQKVADVVAGLEVNCAWLNEADLLPPDLFSALLSRVRQGRYPSPMDGGPAKWRGLWMDFNAPDTENWTYTQLVDRKPDSWDFFRQPPGLLRRDGAYVPNPEAENINVVTTLPETYLANSLNMEEWELKRKVLNEFGYSRAGKPVYGRWNDAVHVAKAELKAVPGIPIGCGIDQGLQPAIVYGQKMPSGQSRRIGELVGNGVDFKTFAEMHLEYVARRGWTGFDMLGHYDPAADSESAAAEDKASWKIGFHARSKLRMKAAPTNALSTRVGAVSGLLGRNSFNPGEPAFLVCPVHCPVLRKGFNSGYRLRKTGTSGGVDEFGNEPVKDKFADVHDGNQYLTLGEGEYHEVLGRNAGTARALDPAVLVKAAQARGRTPYNPHSLLGGKR